MGKFLSCPMLKLAFQICLLQFLWSCMFTFHLLLTSVDFKIECIMTFLCLKCLPFSFRFSVRFYLSFFDTYPCTLTPWRNSPLIWFFFFEQAKMRYINKSFVPLTQEVPKETKQSYNKVPIKTETENNKSKSANPQTNKGTLPPHMITKRKAYIFCFQPFERCNLNLLK